MSPIYAKFNLNIYYSPPYKQKVWHYEYEKEDTDNNRQLN